MGATKEEQYCSSLLTHPLFSIAATSILIAFLYVPHRTLVTLIYSPALIAAILLFLLAALIRFGSPQQLAPPQPQACTTTTTTTNTTTPSSSPTHHQHSDLVEWERPAEWPLDVIYEEGVDGDSSEYSAVGLRLGFTDSDSESDGGFRWEEEGEGMIEIELEEEEEEDNLIEIDISGCHR